MVKISSADILAVLRLFKIADDETLSRRVENIRISNPSLINTMASFRFEKQLYYILFDDTAADDATYVMSQIHIDKQDIVGDIVENPNAGAKTYAMPFKGKDVYLFIAKPAKNRLDVLLAERYPDHSRSTWQKYIKAGFVSVNGQVEISTKAGVSEADSIVITLPDATDYSADNLPIIYLDDNVIVINKPVGVLSHSKGALNDEFTVADFFARYGDFPTESNRTGIVHRLDRATSGIMIGARHPDAMAHLQKQFADRKAKKTYVAVLDGHPKMDEAVIDLPIGRDPNMPSKFRVDPKGKSAITTYKVIDQSEELSLVRLQPHTGRTHQLRVHMKHLGTPILGDNIYGKKQADRMYLHAESLEITIPGGERKTFMAALPIEFKDYFTQSN